MKDSNIHVIELSEYARPEIKEERNKDWVTIGNDNNFFGYLVDRYINSPTNHSIINGICAQIYGKGLDAFDANRKIDQFAAMKSMFRKQDLKRLILDLKIMGMGALQVTYKGKKVDKVTHFPMDTLRPEKMNDKGVIEAWYYHPNWKECKRSDKPERIPVFGSGKPNEIYIVSKYVTSMNYFSLPDWFGSATYCEIEEQVSSYLSNTVENSFSASKLISFNGGIPERQKQMEIKNDVIRKLTGQNGDKLIVSFNNSKETAPEVIDLPIPNAADTYQYLSEECSRKIMIGHRVTSPLLLGLRDGNSSLGSNADEIVNASRLFNNVTIKPFQEQIANCLDAILSVNGISLDLYFKTLEPLEFRDNSPKEEEEENVNSQVSKVVSDNEEEQQDKAASYNGAQIASALSILQNVKEGILNEDQAIVFLVQMLQFDIEVARSMFGGNAVEELSLSILEKKNKKIESQLSVEGLMGKDQEKTILDVLENYGETFDEEEWDLVDEGPAGSHEEEEKLNEIMGFSMNLAKDFIDTAKPNEKSTVNPKQEEAGLYKIRYSYQGETDDKTRDFCKEMISRNSVSNKYGLLYRKQDIDALSNAKPNKGFGVNSGDYVDIFTWKGGPNCRHFWKRMLFFRKRDSNGSFKPKSETKKMENDNRASWTSGNTSLRPKGQEGQKNSDRADKGYKN